MTHTLAARVGLVTATLTVLLSQPVHAQTPQAVLSLPEMWITSIRGSVTDAFNMDPANDIKNSIKNRMQVINGPNGPTYSPFQIKPGKRLHINKDSHALISFPGAGHAMIVGDCTSIILPKPGLSPVTIGFDAHPQSPAKGFFNISAMEMARNPGMVFRLTTKRQSNSADDKTLSIVYAQTLISTRGARFFVIDDLEVGVGAGVAEKIGIGCIVGVFDGSVTVEETVGVKKFEVKPGMVVTVKPHEITPPRAMTKAEASYDIGCKLAALGKDVPAKLPPTMKTTPKNLPGTKVNSLGMTFVPVPKTKVLMCVHETRGADYSAFLAADPSNPAAKGYHNEFGYWGWEDYPVSVKWDDAKAFCEWLSRKEGKKYRLPTDEEWSQATGVGARENFRPGVFPADLALKAASGYPWGSEWPPKNAGNFADLCRKAEGPLAGKDNEFGTGDPDLLSLDDGYREAAPVMSYLPNKLGIYDLAGNVSEWCEDWYDATRSGRVVRGSSFEDDQKQALASSYRVPRATSTGYNNSPIGFRIVMEIP